MQDKDIDEVERIARVLKGLFHFAVACVTVIFIVSIAG